MRAWVSFTARRNMFMPGDMGQRMRNKQRFCERNEGRILHIAKWRVVIALQFNANREIVTPLAVIKS